MRVRSVLLICFLLIIGVSLVAWNLSGRTPARLAIHPWIGYQSLTLCEQEGLLDARQVRLVSTASASESSRMLREGLVDGAAMTLDDVLSLRNDGVPLTVVLFFDASAGADLLLARPDISTLAQLKGRTIGMEDSTLGRLILAEALAQAGLTAQDVRLCYEIVFHHDELWRQGNVDALITYLPVSDDISRESHCLFDSHQIPNMVLDVLAVRSDRLDSLRPALEHLLEQHFYMLNRLLADNPDTLHRLAPLLGLSVEQVQSVLTKLTFPGLEWNQNHLNTENPETKANLNRLIRVMQHSALLGQRVDTAQLLDDSFLPRTFR
ncbi:MAG: ABC transporter substrate-binding protein [Desulfuromonadaceae bacterium]|nr:ABC transporter substrate-binding protein [Desulfuromonadaceae bacterium]